MMKLKLMLTMITEFYKRNFSYFRTFEYFSDFEIDLLDFLNALERDFTKLNDYIEKNIIEPCFFFLIKELKFDYIGMKKELDIFLVTVKNEYLLEKEFYSLVLKIIVFGGPTLYILWFYGLHYIELVILIIGEPVLRLLAFLAYKCDQYFYLVKAFFILYFLDLLCTIHYLIFRANFDDDDDEEEYE